MSLEELPEGEMGGRKWARAHGSCWGSRGEAPGVSCLGHLSSFTFPVLQQGRLQTSPPLCTFLNASCSTGRGLKVRGEQDEPRAQQTARLGLFPAKNRGLSI